MLPLETAYRTAKTITITIINANAGSKMNAGTNCVTVEGLGVMGIMLGAGVGLTATVVNE